MQCLQRDPGYNAGKDLKTPLGTPETCGGLGKGDLGLSGVGAAPGAMSAKRPWVQCWEKPQKLLGNLKRP